MNILVTSHFFSPSIGGIEFISELLAKYFCLSGHQVKLITQTTNHQFLDTDKYDFKVLRKPNLITLWRAYLWCDVVFQNNIELRTLWPLVFIRRPLVIGLQTWIRTTDERRELSQFIKKSVLHLSSNVIACSDAVRADSIQHATVIGNPYNEKIFYRRNVIKDKNSIVFLGRLVSDKGADLLLDACALLPGSSFRLTIVGTGPEDSRLRKIAYQKNLSDSVTFLGSLQGNDLAHILNMHEIMVVPSRWREPFGIVALEGLACGCVVVASSDGGLTDAVGDAGIIFERNNPTDLSIKLQFLIDRPDHQEILRSKAATHLSSFTSSLICKKYLDTLIKTHEIA
jgi:glycogen synthase